jgi:V/A-type H+/Na+-transporting ATPase subunit E
VPIAHLLEALEREARDQAEAVLEEARSTAAAITRDANERLALRRADALAAREAALRAAGDTTLGEARRAGRRRVLEARQRLLDRVFAAARARFSATITEPAYRAALPAHLAEALQAVGDGPAAVRCAEALVTSVRAAVADRKDVAVRSDATAPPGVTVVTADGAIEVDDTLDGRLERLRPRLSLEVLARLEASL